MAGLGIIHGQTAGSITTHNTVVFGHAVLDAGQNLYSIGAFGPVSPNAAQPKSNGGSTCTGGGTGIGPPIFNNLPCPNAYVAKANASGDLVAATYIGGLSASSSTAVGADNAGNIYVGGSTGPQFPTTANAAVPTSTAGTGGFAAKVSADGSSFVYSTFLPTNLMAPAAMAVDANGNAYVAGQTSTNHAYVAELNADGSAFRYVKTLGGSDFDSAAALAIDSSGNVVLTGLTRSPDFPVTPGALQSHLSGEQNAFVAKLDPAGNLLFATYLGGSGVDAGKALQIDSAGNIFVGGSTTSLDFPTTAGTVQPTAVVPMWSDRPGGFVARLAAGGTEMIWGTYLSTDSSGVTLLAVGNSGDVYVTAFTQAGFPVTSSAPQPCMGPSQGYVVVHLDSQGALADATYFGGPNDTVAGMFLAGDGSILLAGNTGPLSTLSQVRFGEAGWKPAGCVTADLFNAATLSTGTAAPHPNASPGELVTLTGFGIGPEAGVSYQPDAQGRVPTTLAGVSVLIGGQPAPVLYAQSRQVNAIVPANVSGTATVTVRYNNQVFDEFTVLIVSANPGIFRLNPGVSTQALAFFSDGSLNSPSNPAAPGSVLSLYATGLGPLASGCAVGRLNAPNAVNLAAGSSGSVPGAVVQYAGGAPDMLCGIYQVNVQIPPDTPSGLFRVSLQSTSPGLVTESAAGPTIVVK